MFSKSLFGLSKLATKSSLFGLQPLRGVSNMKHVSLGGFGDPSVLSFGESPIPKPKEDQVLIKVTNSALNRADTIQRKGRYPPPKGASEIIGLEAAGYLCKPDGTYDTSKKVMALLEGGGHAQYCVAHKDSVIQVPEGISLQEAGGIPEVWITAFLLLELAQIKPKDKVLIYAGASGVGTAAIQLVNLFGGIPIVTCSTDDKIDFTKKVGAEVALNYKKSENLSKDILSVTGPKGVDIILDCVGPAYTSVNTEVAGVDARWILYGLLTGAKAKEFNMASLVTKRISLISTTLRTRSSQYKGDLIKRFNERVIPHFKEGKCKAYIDSVVDVDWKDPKPLQDAHTRIEDNKNYGKIILNFKD